MDSGGGVVKEWTTFGTTMLALVGTLNVSQGLLVGFASGGIGFDKNDVAFTSATTWAAATGDARCAARRDRPRAARPQRQRPGRRDQRRGPARDLAVRHAPGLPGVVAADGHARRDHLFILNVARAHDDADAEPAEIPIASVTKLALRRNSRSDRYRGRHKAGRPIVRHEDVILVDIVEELEPAVEALTSTWTTSTSTRPLRWVRAVGARHGPDGPDRAGRGSLRPLPARLPRPPDGPAAGTDRRDGRHRDHRGCDGRGRRGAAPPSVPGRT